MARSQVSFPLMEHPRARPLFDELRIDRRRTVVACGGQAGRDRWSGGYRPVIRWRNSTKTSVPTIASNSVPSESITGRSPT